MSMTRVKIYAIETRRTLWLAGPIIMGQLGQIMLHVIDSLMVGRLGAVPLAASALASSLSIIFLVFGFGVSSCVSTLVSRANGAQNRFECGEYLRHGFLLNVSVAVLMIVLVELTLPFLVLLDQPAEVVAEAKGFMRLLSFSFLPVLAAQTFKNFAEALGDTMRPMIIMIFALPLNAALNWVLIFGNLGLPQLGLMGAGYATLITRTLAAIALMFLVLKSVRLEENRPAQWWIKFERSRFVEMLKVGLPSGFQSLFEVGAFSVAAVMMGWLGTKTLAAHQIAINVASLTFMVPMGLSFAVAIRVGNAMGAKDYQAARRIGLGAFGVAIFFAILFSIGFVLGREEIPKLYIDDPEVWALAGPLFLLAGAFQIFDGLQVVGVGCLRGLLDIRFPTVVTFVAYWVLSLPLGYVFAFWLDWKGAGIWTGLSIGLLVPAVLLTTRFNALMKKRLAEQSGHP